MNTLSVSASEILFHITEHSKAVQIMEKNRFELKPADGTEAEEATSLGSYYLSTTRSKLGAYTVGKAYATSAIFVLDGTKLSHTYKVRPIDYWGTNELTPEQRTKADEAEDRVFSRKPSIDNATKYIVEIHAHVGKAGERSRYQAVMLKRACLKRRVPVFFYSNVNDLIRMNKKRATTLGISDQGPAPEVYERSPEYQQAKMKERGLNPLMGWIELNKTPIRTKPHEDAAKLSRFGKGNYRKLQSNYSGDDLRGLMADMHNAKSLPYGDVSGERESLDKLIAILRKNRQTVKEFIAALYAKWYPREAV